MVAAKGRRKTFGYGPPPCWPWALMVLVTLLTACSGNGSKSEDEDEAKQGTATPVRGQWVTLPPNVVWVPQPASNAPPPGYGAPPASYGAPPAGYGASQAGGYGGNGYGGPPTPQATPGGNPWAVSASPSGQQRRPEWGHAPRTNRWAGNGVPTQGSRYRPLEQQTRSRSVPNPNPVTGYRNQSPWSTAAPYDQPVGSSARPRYGNAGGQGYGQGYGQHYPLASNPYGAYASPYGYGAWPGGIGTTLPYGAGAPGGVWPGAW